MPVRVTVVKRARRRSFALLRATPAWIGSVWAALRTIPPAPPPAPKIDFPGDAGMPALTFSADGVHRCTGCNLCVEICPSRALSLLVSDVSGAVGAAGTARTAAGEAGLVVHEFALEVGGCIGCGRCVEECPDEALEMHGTPVVAIALRSGGPPPIDLLDRGAARR